MKGTKGRRCHVLIARVNVDDRPDDAEDKDLGDGAGPEGFGKVSEVPVSISTYGQLMFNCKVSFSYLGSFISAIKLGSVI